jgi:hypothetical protein
VSETSQEQQAKERFQKDFGRLGAESEKQVKVLAAEAKSKTAAPTVSDPHCWHEQSKDAGTLAVVSRRGR